MTSAPTATPSNGMCAPPWPADPSEGLRSSGCCGRRLSLDGCPEEPGFYC